MVARAFDWRVVSACVFVFLSVCWFTLIIVDGVCVWLCVCLCACVFVRERDLWCA